MRDNELRGLILEALYSRRRKDLVNLDRELGTLPVPHRATESILRQLVKKGLVERPIQSLNGLGNARALVWTRERAPFPLSGLRPSPGRAQVLRSARYRSAPATRW